MRLSGNPEGFEVLSSCQDAESVPGRSAFGPSRPFRHIPVMVSFLTHSGHLAFAAGTALHAPHRTLVRWGQIDPQPVAWAAQRLRAPDDRHSRCSTSCTGKV